MNAISGKAGHQTLGGGEGESWVTRTRDSLDLSRTALTLCADADHFYRECTFLDS